MGDLYKLIAKARGQTVEQLTSDERAQIWAIAAPVMEPGFEVVPNSERDESDPVEVVPYNAEWPRRFGSCRERLSTVLRVKPMRIEHVGSTAIPDLPAKPVVDIQVSVEDIRRELAYVPAIESIGVQLRSRDNEHRYFRPFSGHPRDVHVHVCNAGSTWEARHLLFRDFLRANDDAKTVYVAAKRDAATRWTFDRIAYADAKTAVIDQLMAEAETWARQTGWQVG